MAVSALGGVCRYENRIAKARILNEVRRRVGKGGFRSIFMKCYSVPRVAYSGFDDPLRKDCINVVFFGVRDYIPYVGIIVVRDDSGRKAGFYMGEVDVSFAARLVVCSDGIMELWAPKIVRNVALYKLLVGLGRIIEREKPGSTMISLGELCSYRAVLVDVLSQLTTAYQLILLKASLKGRSFS